VLDNLTADESALVTAAREGRVLTCDAPIRAELIRELLLGRHGELDPRGVRLHGARVSGELDLDYVTAVVGLDLVDCVLAEPLYLSHAAVPWLELARSRISGIQAAGLRVASDLNLAGVTVSGAGKGGVVRLRDAHVGGTLTMEQAKVSNDSGPALHADGLRVDGVAVLREARMSGDGESGALRLLGARIGSELDMEHVELRNDSGPALDAADLVVDRHMFLERAVVSGHGQNGAVRLAGAHIGGALTMDDAGIDNASGPAVFAESLIVDGNLLLTDARVFGTGSLGAFRLASAHVGDNMYVVNTELRNDSGPALYADGMRVEDTIVLRRGRMSGTSDDGAIWLRGAQLGGLRIVETEIRNGSGPALFASQLKVDGHVLLERVRMSGTGALLRLAVARVSGQFELKGGLCPDPCDGAHLLDVNDFSYGTLAGVDWRQWLHLIRRHTKEYHPSPYQQLAAVERAAGHDGNARNILITQQQDLRHRAPTALGGWLTRRFHWLWGALAGYGYRARRTALALLIALAAAGLVSLWAGHVTTSPGRHAAEHTIASGTPRTQCSTVELIGLGLDRGLPLGPTGLRTRCDLDTGTAAGQTFTVLLWVVQAAVWGLATLALAGYTGLIRKTA
jgi:hypothetical protein